MYEKLAVQKTGGNNYALMKSALYRNSTHINFIADTCCGGVSHLFERNVKNEMKNKGTNSAKLLRNKIYVDRYVELNVVELEGGGVHVFSQFGNMKDTFLGLRHEFVFSF